MKFEFSQNPLDKISADILVVFAFKGDKTFVPTKELTHLDSVLKGAISNTLKLEEFKGKEGSAALIHTQGKILSPRVVVVGLGKKGELATKNLRKAAGSIAKRFTKKIDSLALVLPIPEVSFDLETQSQCVAEGFLLGSYTFAQYKKKEKSDREFATIIISAKKESEKKQIYAGVKLAELYAQATRLARDLVNEQAAIATPTFLAKTAEDIARKNPKITCKIIEKAEAQKMGMEAFLGIARASDTPPKFIVLEYKPARGGNKRKVGIIGKGITFDSGGINVKPESAMTTMKCDMSGAAAVIGLFSVISAVEPAFSVMGVIAATPNLISGTALVPGDVVRAMNGKTIEILNTDAEGRVTMADSLSYALKNGATELVDLATLTGACEVALGTDIAGLMSNNKGLSEKVKTAAFEAGEEVWELPLPKEYKKLNKSDVADIANIPTSRWGGAITAGLFLEEFVDNKPWVHLDIAGPAFLERDTPLGPKGGTGFGVRLLLNLVRQK